MTNKQEALDRTAAALKTIQYLESILSRALDENSKKNVSQYIIDFYQTKKIKPPFVKIQQPVYFPYPPKPDIHRAREVLAATTPAIVAWWNKISPEKRKEREEEQLLTMLRAWQKIKDPIEEENIRLSNAFEIQNERAKIVHGRELAAYHQECAALAQEKADYESHQIAAVIRYCDKVLQASTPHYTELFPRQWEIDYKNRTLWVQYQLPSPLEIPKLKEVKYFPTKDECKEVFLSEKKWRDLYESVIYQTVLRTFYELFQADVADALDTIALNGIVKAIDKASGHLASECILSLEVDKDEFLGLKLEAIDPKICFNQLKKSKKTTPPKILLSLKPTIQTIQPIKQIQNIQDGRFIESYSIIHHLNENTNLAAMDWEDFEHLVREIFEKEFKPFGGEVHLTQASRDGGVDAVVFDPDPIRGGKIVIQAKRYTKVVNVSAVRDLYGTVMNEGANKGILITTAHFGNDSYDFAKGKPLTLINGENLLSLLAKHGHKATIDTKAARLKPKLVY